MWVKRHLKGEGREERSHCWGVVEPRSLRFLPFKGLGSQVGNPGATFQLRKVRRLLRRLYFTVELEGWKN